jgi:hypothetical protein
MPLYSFDDDGELYGFSVEWTEPDNMLSDAEVVSDAELDAMVIHAGFEATIDNGQDQEIYLANRFEAARDLRGRSVTACVRLLEEVDGMPDLPRIEVFVTTSEDLISGFSSALALQRDSTWREIRVAVDNPTRTDGEMPIFPDDARGIGFKVFTGLSGNYGTVRIAVDGITIE